MFYDPTRFAFVAAFEGHWQTIRAEYQAVRDRLMDWPEKKLYGDGWQVFGLFDFPHGAPLDDNLRRCPVTARLVREHVPGHGAVGFSVLRPGTRIAPHRGYAGAFLRCHLGLIVPPGECVLKVGEITHAWAEGKMVVFDDRVSHEAWNLTAHERVVLLMDFVPEE